MTTTKLTQAGVEVLWVLAPKTKLTQVGVEVMSVAPPSDFLTLSDGAGTITVRVTATPVSMTTAEPADRERAFDGTMRAIFAGASSGTVTRRRAWTVVTVALSASDADALVTLLTSSPRIMANGQWLGGPVLVWPQLAKRTPTAAAGGAILYAVSFTLTEA